VDILCITTGRRRKENATTVQGRVHTQSASAAQVATHQLQQVLTAGEDLSGMINQEKASNCADCFEHVSVDLDASEAHSGPVGSSSAVSEGGSKESTGESMSTQLLVLILIGIIIIALCCGCVCVAVLCCWQRGKPLQTWEPRHSEFSNLEEQDSIIEMQTGVKGRHNGLVSFITFPVTISTSPVAPGMIPGHAINEN